MSLRTEWLDTRYDFWLDYYGVPGKARRELRRELKANLSDAVADRGWERARDGLGSIRLLAKDNAEALRDPRKPAWNSGATAAALAFVLILGMALFGSVAFGDAVRAFSLPAGTEIEAGLTMMPGGQGLGRGGQGLHGRPVDQPVAALRVAGPGLPAGLAGVATGAGRTGKVRTVTCEAGVAARLDGPDGRELLH